MEGFGSSGFNITTVTKRLRSNMPRKRRSEPQLPLEGCDVSPPSSTRSSDNASRQSTESGFDDACFRRKELNVNSSALKVSSIYKYKGEFGRIHGNGSLRSRPDIKQRSEGVAPGNWKSTCKVKEISEIQTRSPDKYVNIGSGVHSHSGGASNGPVENKLRKVKLKVGGITHTIHAKPNVEGAANSGPPAKPPCSSDASRCRQKLILQDNSDGDLPPEKGSGSQGDQWEGSDKGSFGHVPKELSRVKGIDGLSEKQGNKSPDVSPSEPTRKSKRVPKRHVMDGESDERDEDDEIRYLERLKWSKVTMNPMAELETVGGNAIGNRKSSKAPKTRKAIYKGDEDFALSRQSEEARKKSRLDIDSEDVDYVEEEVEEAGPEAKMRNQEPLDPTDGRREISLTARQRALQSCKDGSGGNGASLIEFPDGLLPAPVRKEKEKLSEVEKQMKKVEAAQRRKIQVEKAAREAEAEAIRKILGQDSSRKKREDKLQKKRDELAQERAANAIAPNAIRWVIRPTGTTVIFPEGVELPSLFNSKLISYPPPREKCAHPSCTKPYKYRDSKSNLPLCSLQCYKAVRGNLEQATC